LARRIGELLIQRGVATAAQIEAALADPRLSGQPLASRLHSSGIDEGALAAVLAEHHGMPGVDLSRTTVALEALTVVPRAVAEADLIFPLSLEGGRIHMAMANPLDERVISEVRFVTGREVSAYAALKKPIQDAIEGAYAALARGEPVWRGSLAASEAPRVDAALPEGAGEAELVELTDLADDEPIDLDDELTGIADDDEPLEPAALVAIEVGEPEPDTAAARPLALVVDDEPDILKLVGMTLEARGYAVETAADGAEGLEKAERLVPAVILLDAMLPKVHGFEACRRIKSGPRTRHVPVVMMTAIYRGWRFAQDARENFGAEDYVEKPFRLDDLVQRLEAARAAAGARAGQDRAAHDEAAPFLARGRELVAAGQVEEAVAALSEATRLAPFLADAQYQLGRALTSRGDGFAAMTALERAVELRPGHLPALRALAALYEEKGFRRKAAEALERALPAIADQGARTKVRDELLRLLG
jgi:CheY-like chemotaxis protein